MAKKTGRPKGKYNHDYVKPIRYKNGFGFISGYNQIVEQDNINYTRNAKKFNDVVCAKVGCSQPAFEKWRNTGRPPVTARFVREFLNDYLTRTIQEFGVTENIWDNEVKIN